MRRQPLKHSLHPLVRSRARLGGEPEIQPSLKEALVAVVIAACVCDIFARSRTRGSASASLTTLRATKAYLPYISESLLPQLRFLSTSTPTSAVRTINYSLLKKGEASLAVADNMRQSHVVSKGDRFHPFGSDRSLTKYPQVTIRGRYEECSQTQRLSLMNACARPHLASVPRIHPNPQLLGLYPSTR